MVAKDMNSLVILAPYLINVILLFNRKKKWVRSSYKWIVVVGLSVVGIILGYLDRDYENKDVNEVLVHWAFITPLVFSMLDYLLMRWSFRIHGRDLYLWLRGSSEIDDQKFSGGNHVRISDRLFSLTLLFVILFLPFLILFFI